MAGKSDLTADAGALCAFREPGQSVRRGEADRGPCDDFANDRRLDIPIDLGQVFGVREDTARQWRSDFRKGASRR